jgi:hypothetical protein
MSSTVIEGIEFAELDEIPEYTGSELAHQEALLQQAHAQLLQQQPDLNTPRFRGALHQMQGSATTPPTLSPTRIASSATLQFALEEGIPSALIPALESGAAINLELDDSGNGEGFNGSADSEEYNRWLESQIHIAEQEIEVQCARCGKFRKIPPLYWSLKFGFTGGMTWTCAQANWLPLGCHDNEDLGMLVEDRLIKMWSGIPAEFLTTPERKYFFAKLIDNYTRQGNPLRRYPVIAGKMIDFFSLYDAAMQFGGLNGVVQNGSWKNLAEAACGPEVVNASGVSASVKKNYIQYLHKMEEMYGLVGDGPDFLFSTYARRRTLPEGRPRSSRGGRGRGRGRGGRGRGRGRLSISQRSPYPPVPDFEESELQVALAMSEVQVLKATVNQAATQFAQLEKQLYSAIGTLSDDMLADIVALREATKQLLEVAEAKLLELSSTVLGKRSSSPTKLRSDASVSPRRQSPRLRAATSAPSSASPSKRRKVAKD